MCLRQYICVYILHSHFCVYTFIIHSLLVYVFIYLFIYSICHSCFHTSPKAYYQGTLIDYTLDQLFIHLDDPSPLIQQEIFTTIVSLKDVVSSIDMILKKVDINMQTHRSPVYCERLRNEIQWYEILS